MSETSGRYTVVPYDRSGAPQPALTVNVEDTAGLDAAWEAARVALPAGTAAFAVYDAGGALARLGILPADTLTDDPDVSSMAMDPEGSLVVTGHDDGNVRLWDLRTGDPLWSRPAGDEPITGVVFVPRGPWVLAWADDGPLLLFAQNGGELVLRVEDPQVGPFVAAPAPDGAEVACTGARATRIRLPDGALLPGLDEDRAGGEDGPADEGVVWVAYAAAAPGAEGEVVGLRAGDEADELVVWDRKSGARLAALPVAGFAGACDASPDGRTVALGVTGERESVEIYDVPGRKLLHSVRIDGGGLHDLRFAPDGRAVILHDATLGIVRVDVATGEAGPPLPESRGVGPVLPLEGEVLPEESETPPIMVTRDSQGMLELTPLEDREMFGPVGRALSADGARYAAVPFATDNNYLTVYDLARGAGVVTLPHRGNVREAWVSSSGDVVAARAAKHVTVWRLPPARDREKR